MMENKNPEALLGGPLPSPVKNPFSKEHINEIHINMLPNILSEGFRFFGQVSFKNDKTRGTQSFEGKSLADVYNQIYEFCTTL